MKNKNSNSPTRKKRDVFGQKLSVHSAAHEA